MDKSLSSGTSCNSRSCTLGVCWHLSGRPCHARTDTFRRTCSPHSRWTGGTAPFCSGSSLFGSSSCPRCWLAPDLSYCPWSSDSSGSCFYCTFGWPGSAAATAGAWRSWKCWPWSRWHSAAWSWCCSANCLGSCYLTAGWFWLNSRDREYWWESFFCVCVWSEWIVRQVKFFACQLGSVSFLLYFKYKISKYKKCVVVNIGLLWINRKPCV